MASLARITNNFFVSLLNRLGVRPPFLEGFELSNVVQPVSIVDADVSLSAIATSPQWAAIVTAGELTAPVANTVLADTGQLAAGNYEFLVWLSMGDTGNNDIILQHRNSADSANVSSHRFCFTAKQRELFTVTATLALNERMRCLITANVAASQVVQATIRQRTI